MMNLKTLRTGSLKLCLLFGIAALTASCTSLTSFLPEPAPANTVYRLSTSVLDETIKPNQNALVLRVDRPTVPSQLAGNSITVSPGDERVLKASGAEWAEKVPDLIQGSVIDVLSSRPDIIGILPISGARTELRIHLNVRNFEASYDQGENNAPLAIVRYTATLADAGNRNLLGSFDVRKTERARSNRVSEIVRAQDLANTQAINSIADWVLETSSKTSS